MALPQPKLDDKNFETLVEECTKLIPRYSPQWTDHNRHDPGITLLELFAWLAEMQQFYLDSIGPQSYLKFLKFLGGLPAEVLPARTEINFAPPDGLGPVYVPDGTKLTNGALETSQQISFETGAGLLVLPHELKRVLTS